MTGYRRGAVLALSTFLASTASNVWATEGSLLGSWSTSDAQETRTSCGTPGADGLFTVAILLSFLDQMGTSFAGSGSTSDQSRFGFSGTLSGASVSGSFSGPDSSGSFNGTVAGNTLNVTYSGSDTAADGCSFNGTAKLTRAVAVDPANEAGTQTTSPQRTQDAARNYLQPLGSHLNQVMRGGRATGAGPVQGGFLLQGGTGLAAGEGERVPFGLWGSYSRAHSDNSDVLREFNSDHDVFLGGIDFIPNDWLVVGVALGYENTDTTTNFNGGRQKFDAFTVGPYFGALINDWLSVDATAAWSWTEFDQWRTNASTGAQVTSDPDGTRALLAGNLNVSRAVGDFFFSGRAGVLWAQDSVDPFIESDGTSVERNATRLGQFRAGAEVAYAAGDFEPYVGGTYEFDYSTSGLALASGLGQRSNDDTGVIMNVGVRYFRGNFNGSLEYSKVLGRENFDMDTFMILLRGEF